MESAWMPAFRFPSIYYFDGVPPGMTATSLLAELVLDQPDERGHGFLGAVPLGPDEDRIAHRRPQHHQPHDRGAGDLRPVPLDLDRNGKAGGKGDEARAGAGVEAAPVGQRHDAFDGAQTVSPRISEATLIYL